MRGAISVTERTSHIARVRALAALRGIVCGRPGGHGPSTDQTQPARTGKGSHQPLTGHHQVARGPYPTMPTKNPRPRLFHARRRLHLSPAQDAGHDGIAARNRHRRVALSVCRSGLTCALQQGAEALLKESRLDLALSGRWGHRGGSCCWWKGWRQQASAVKGSHGPVEGRGLRSVGAADQSGHWICCRSGRAG